jgi:ABC-type dipeptide/oligopeptide/nickel transport systems, permease components
VSARAIEERPLSPFRLGLIRFAGNRTAIASAIVILGFVLAALAAPLLAPHDPAEADLFRRLQPPAWAGGGEWAFPLGCDGLGRDILSRLIWGARVSLLVASLVIAIAAAIGTLAGLAAGYFRGWTDTLISRLVDTLLGFPYLVFAIGLMAMMGPGLHNIVLALLYKEWVFTAAWCAARRWPRASRTMSRRRARWARGRRASCCARSCPTCSRPCWWWRPSAWPT